ncbi:uncharacterized protein LOC125667173 isoform X2 [Ostrea edulis]|uniref:uncharacterized protein LOC125667173 isoform X2 n=1 Tax=Ostrea edulis TaxID=37623 RepID=UPI0024AEFD3D|nr:uncharacterized protein LOC125667173 isoform X2 [Ostrea edulis]
MCNGVGPYVAFITSMIFCCLETGGQTITLCSNPVKQSSCLITCSTPDTTQDVTFFRGPSLQGGCIYTRGPPICPPDISQKGTVTIFTISSLSKPANEGDWTCKYGAQTSTAETLTVYTEPSVTTFINGSSTTPVPWTAFKIVNISARSYCFFPSVNSANLQYSVGIFGSLQLLTTISVVGIQGSSVGCDVYEFDLQANATVDIESSTYAELSGKSNVYFQITFTSNLGTQYSTDFRLGPYDFEASSVDQFLVG